LAKYISGPWLVGGDLNVVMNDEEKIGGYENFECCISNCELTEVSYKGSPFTWWNGRAGNDCIYERLDKFLIN